MNSLIMLVSGAAVGAGVLAEANLLRMLLRERRAARRGSRLPEAEQEQKPRPAAQRRDQRARRWLGLGIGVPAVLGSPALAATGTEDPPATDAPAQATPPDQRKSPFSFQVNLDYTTAYFYHGIIQEDTGLILQPAAKLTINLHEGDDFKLDAFVGTWNSFHGQKTAAQTHGDFSEYWYESDLLAGLTLTKGALSLTTQYVFLTSPSDAYETVQELDVTLAFDDTSLLDKLALHPYALIAIETGADASDGAHSDTGTYLELGVAPGFSFDAVGTTIAVSFPVSVGLSISDYYQNSDGDDDTFGFVQIGAKASIPLPFGERYGAWTLNAGVAALFLGDQTSDYNGGQDEQLIGTIGVQVNF